LPSTTSYEPPNQDRYPDYVPTPPANQSLPQQEPGTRPARALPYELYVDGAVNSGQETLELAFRNSGNAGAAFHVRFADGQIAPRTYTVGADDAASDSFDTGASYDLAVFGPNGFLRAFAGGFASGSANLSVKTIYDKGSGGIALLIQNHGSHSSTLQIADAYSGKTTTHQLPPQAAFTSFNDLRKSFGWYDFTLQVESDPTFRRRLAGHVETGRDSMTDPAIG
jgi:phospholipase C